MSCQLSVECLVVVSLVLSILKYKGCYFAKQNPMVPECVLTAVCPNEKFDSCACCFRYKKILDEILKAGGKECVESMKSFVEACRWIYFRKK